MRETDLLKVIVISSLAFVFGVYIIGSMDKIQSKDMQRIDKMSELVKKETKKVRQNTLFCRTDFIQL